MDEKEKEIIKFQSKHAQNCKSCSKLITLNEKYTFLCSKCKLYFCEECALFYNENPTNIENNCPGGESNPHEAIMVKITRNVKEYMPIGLSIEDLERKKSSNKDKTMKIIDSENLPKKTKSTLKILDD